MEFLIQMLIRACIETVYLTGIIILVGMLLGIMRNYTIKNFARSFGMKSIMITGFIGVPVHEMSHAIFAAIFGHKITAVKLLQRPDENGVMGYVEHSYNQNSIYQQIGNFFIGTAPIFGGILSVVGLMHFMIPRAYDEFISILKVNSHVTVINKAAAVHIFSMYKVLVKTIFSTANFHNIYFYIFLFIAICICSHISLSYADIRGATGGLITIFLVLLILNVVGWTKYLSIENITKYNVLITAFLILAVLLSAITFLISLVLTIIKH
ncbi:hypothetical protein [Clostridium ljungdahlii]|uniref:Uncharacterized protein n=1 Tax=Clostridium ljungdahlii TaxID=1538 RepID=A0A166SBY1_9CLOT|nr:hypothetical protein [Clostridium ljungdahlii]OAA91960.1 hypothetical protein WY13_00362 [Clostridium ljungdahlii]